MSSDWPNEPGESGEFAQPKKQGMSTGAKVALILGVVVGGIALLCCGVLGWIGYRAQQAVTEDPAGIQAMTQEIVRMEIPERFRPVAAMDFGKIPFVGQAMPGGMRMAMYESGNGSDRGALMLMEFGQEMAQQMGDPKRQMQDAMRQQGHDMRDLNIDEDAIEVREFEIRGETVEFQFAKAQDPSGQTAFRQILGSFDGDRGLVILMLQVPEEQYDEAEVVRMIESIE